jgi:hypothetical protein
MRNEEKPPGGDVTSRLQSLMIANGALVLLVGMLSGLVFLFHLLGEISLWPIPAALHFQISGGERGWRAAHVGNIANGTMVVALGAVLHRLSLGPTARKWVAWGLIYTAWGNCVFYIFSAALTTGRGLSFGANRFGGGDVYNSIAFLAAYVAVFTVIVSLVLIARAAFAAAKSSRES